MTPPIIKEERRCGNTTRIIDSLIQELFETGKCKVWDHYTNVRRNREILSKTTAKIIRRLEYEHNLAIGVDYRLKNTSDSITFELLNKK